MAKKAGVGPRLRVAACYGGNKTSNRRPMCNVVDFRLGYEVNNFRACSSLHIINFIIIGLFMVISESNIQATRHSRGHAKTFVND